MAKDVQLLPFATHAAPSSWIIPDSLKIMPKAISAVFDGSAAAGAFKPTLEILSDSGDLVARVPTDTTVAAGGSAEVTFAPFLEDEPSSTSTSIPGQWLGIQQHSSSLSLLPYPDASYQQDVDWTGGQWRTSSSSTFSWNGGNPTHVSLGDDAISYLFTIEAVVEVDVPSSGGLAPYRTDAPGTYDPLGLAIEVVVNDRMPQLNGNQYGLSAARTVTYLWGVAFTGTVQPTRAIHSVTWVGVQDAFVTWPSDLNIRLLYWSRFATPAVCTAFMLRVGATPVQDDDVTVFPLV